MSKKNKGLTKLRREVEILKSQLKNRPAWEIPAPARVENQSLKNDPPADGQKSMSERAETASGPPSVWENNNPDLKKDLLKSLGLAAFSFTIIFAIHFLQNRFDLNRLPATALLSKFGF